VITEFTQMTVEKPVENHGCIARIAAFCRMRLRFAPSWCDRQSYVRSCRRLQNDRLYLNRFSRRRSMTSRPLSFESHHAL